MPEDHVLKILTEIAHFHAVAYQYIQQYPGGIEKFKEDDPTWNVTSFYEVFVDKGIIDMIHTAHTGLFRQSAKVSTIMQGIGLEFVVFHFMGRKLR